MANIRIPAPLRQYSAGLSSVSVNGETVGAAVESLTEQYPELREHLFEGSQLRSFVNIFLNQEDVRYLDGADTELNENDTLMIIPSIAGGRETLGSLT